MIKTTRTFSTGEQLHIFDNVFSPHEHHQNRTFVEKSFYKIIFSASGFIDHGLNLLGSVYSDDDLQKMGVFNNENFRHIADNYCGGYTRTSQWVTLTTYFSKSHFHPDNKGKTLIYYLSTEWDINHGGETLFCNSDGDVELAVSSKPNRVVAYDNYLLHKAAQISPGAPEYRFTLVCQFNGGVK